VIVIDLGKGWLATNMLPRLPAMGEPVFGHDWMVFGCAIAVTLGHVYPVWYEFRGGKGAATLVGAIIGMAPQLLLPALVVWLVTVVLTGYVGLATMLGALSLPIVVLLHPQGEPAVMLLVFALLVAGFVSYTHRTNIVRMLDGTESRARRLWLFGMGRSADK